MNQHVGIFRLFVRDGIGPFLLLGISLIFVGIFLLVQSYTGEFLPHDIEALGMTAQQLALFQDGKIVNFMFHDRVSFGGSLITVGLLYIWIALFPLRQKEKWAWFVLLVSGLYGFGSFMTYIGYEYYDSWHGIGTLVLIPIFLLGLVYSFQKGGLNWREFLEHKSKFGFSSKSKLGYSLLLFTGLGLFLGGITIMIVGMTSVFVPQDLGYMKINVCGLEKINANLIPVIAHDRASFGGGLATIGVMFSSIIWYSKATRILWETSALAISIGFYSAIGIHFIIGYLDFWHLAPAYFGLAIFTAGLFMTFETMTKQ